jgi:hypothetical protein
MLQDYIVLPAATKGSCNRVYMIIWRSTYYPISQNFAYKNSQNRYADISIKLPRDRYTNALQLVIVSRIILVIPYILGLIEFAIGPLKNYIVSKSSLAFKKNKRAIAIPTI